MSRRHGPSGGLTTPSPLTRLRPASRLGGRIRTRAKANDGRLSGGTAGLAGRRRSYAQLATPTGRTQLPARAAEDLVAAACGLVAGVVAVGVGQAELLRHNRHYFCAMSASLAEQFEGFARCCLELARSAETTAARARLMQMAQEYLLATSLIPKELSPERTPPGPTGQATRSAPDRVWPTTPTPSIAGTMQPAKT
jgi:hypothetical protein